MYCGRSDRSDHNLGVLESLLDLPGRVEQRDGAWSRLTHRDSLFDALKGVIESCGDPPWTRLLDAVEKWRGKYDPYDDADKNRLLRQWWFVRGMVWCAQQAARIRAQSMTDAAGEIGRICFSPDDPPEYCGNGVTPDWAAGCIEEFLGLARPLRRVEVDAAGWDRDSGEGFLFTLELELLEGGAARVFHHPADAFATYLDDQFETSMRMAWSAAVDLAVKRGLPFPGVLQARWRVLAERRTPAEDTPLREITGTSAGGAALRGWFLALAGRVPDEEVLVLAQIAAQQKDEFRLAEVSGIKAKARRAERTGRIDTIVVAGDENRREAEEVLGAPRVMEADPNGLADIRSRRAEDLLAYLEGLESTLEWIPVKDRFTPEEEGRPGDAALPFAATQRSKAKFTLMNAAAEARERIDGAEAALDSIALPVFIRLRHAAEALEDEEKVKEFLVGAGCVPERPAALTDAECGAAALLMSLVEHQGVAERLAPWIWLRLTREPRGSKEAVILWMDGEDLPPTGEEGGGHERLAPCLDALYRTSRPRVHLTYGSTLKERRRTPAARTALVAAVLAVAAALVVVFMQSEHLMVQADIYRVRENEKVLLSDVDNEIAQGDQIFMELSSEEPLYVYVFNADDRGASHVLFPIKDETRDNPLPGEVDNRLPTQGDDWKVETSAKREIYYIFASKSPIAEAESQRDAIEELDRLRAMEETRGTGELVPASSQEMAESVASSLERLFQELRRRPEAVWVRRIVAKHVNDELGPDG